jgi:Zincin-like metallopeptidase
VPIVRPRVTSLSRDLGVTRSDVQLTPSRWHGTTTAPHIFLTFPTSMGQPPDGQPLLGLYRGVPLPRRSSTYSGVLPDKISIFGGPITRLAAGDADRLRREVRHVVLHEIAHHFGISDERLIELDRY